MQNVNFVRKDSNCYDAQIAHFSSTQVISFEVVKIMGAFILDFLLIFAV